MNQTIFCDMCELIADIMDLEDNAPDVHNDHLCANEAWTLLRKITASKCKEIYENYENVTDEVLDYVNGVMKCGIVWDTILKQDFNSYEDIYKFFFENNKHLYGYFIEGKLQFISYDKNLNDLYDFAVPPNYEIINLKKQ